MNLGRIGRLRASETESCGRDDARVAANHPAVSSSEAGQASTRSAAGVSRRVPFLAVTLVGASVCLGAPWIHPPIRLVYNASPSVALGWYLRVPASRLAVGMFVVARLPPAAARLAADRGYLPITVPVVKRIAADHGESVCERSRILSIDGRPVARALIEDSEGRPLPTWSGCQDLSRSEYLLLGDGALDSYDSRYFGPVTARAILGRAIPLWTWR